MQVNTIDVAQLADLLTDGERLLTVDNNGQMVHVLHHAGLDMLAIVNPLDGRATCIYPDAVAFGGLSIHQEAREMLGAEE